MKKLVLSQTCQGTVLEKLLLTSAEFCQEFTCTFIPNYEITDGRAQVSSSEALEAELGDCNVLIYHDISKYNFAELIRLMPDDSIAIKIPYITSTIYWPSHDYYNPIWLAKRGSTALIPWPCLLLNELICQHKDKQKALDAYMTLDIPSVIPVDARFLGQVDYLRKAEDGSIFHIADFVEQQFKTTRLFHLVNHPSMPVFLEVANSILRHFQMQELPSYNVDPFSNHQTPVHPSIIKHYELEWCNTETKHLMLDKTFTFEEYAAFYIDEYVATYQYTLHPAPPVRQKKPGLLQRLRRTFRGHA